MNGFEWFTRSFYQNIVYHQITTTIKQPSHLHIFRTKSNAVYQSISTWSFIIHRKRFIYSKYVKSFNIRAIHGFITLKEHNKPLELQQHVYVSQDTQEKVILLLCIAMIWRLQVRASVAYIGKTSNFLFASISKIAS